MLGSVDRDLLAIVDKVGGPFTPVGFYYRTMIRPRRAWPLYEKVLRNLAGLGRVAESGPPHRRHDTGSHWLEAYPFVRLHQSSSFYGVASTVLGGGRIQTGGPEAGLHERADQPTICRLLRRSAGRPDGRTRAGSSSSPAASTSATARSSRASPGERFEVPERCRIVDARYLAPDIPAETPPQFEVADGARVIPVNDLVRVEEAPSQYVVVGSGKTATDACIWLLARGVDPDAICWVRPRDPWMLNRALIQPDPAIYLGMVADMMRGRRGGGVARRAVPPARGRRHHAAHRPLGHADDGEGAHPRPVGARAAAQHRERRTPGPHTVSVGAAGSTSTTARSRIADDALVVNCAADGLKMPPLVPIWAPEAITLQPVRAGFPCFGAALAGYVEATRERRRREEPAVPAVVVRQHPVRLGADERPRHAQRRRRSAPSPTSRSGPTGSPSTPHASHPIGPGSRPSRRPSPVCDRPPPAPSPGSPKSAPNRCRGRWGWRHLTYTDRILVRGGLTPPSVWAWRRHIRA